MVRLAVAQVNPTVGDLEGNSRKIIDWIERARSLGVELVIFPELVLTGYPPKDLLLKPSFIRGNLERLREIIRASRGISVVVGFVDSPDTGSSSTEEPGCSSFVPESRIYNAAALIEDGEMVGVQHKVHLPNYDVFDEKRYFRPGERVEVFRLAGLRVGVNICEDIWVEDGPPYRQAEMGAELLVNISASPFFLGKTGLRGKLVSRRARETGLPVVYCNLVGGQDDLVFDGASFIYNPRGVLVASARPFQEDLLVWDSGTRGRITPVLHPLESVCQAIQLGIADYTRKNGFKRVLIGLSGGIDSALTAVLAVRALGAPRVTGVSMPSKITSAQSTRDARELAQNLGIELKEIPIHEIFDTYLQALSGEFRGTRVDVTEENLQARIRGNLLMALSNKFGYLLLSTGNKSEMAVGYTTLYGDMAGGLAVISDVPKTLVYQLARYLNLKREIIPESIILKPPSAELRPGQVDTDTLPPYDVLDPILHLYIEEGRSLEEIVAHGYPPDLVRRVIGMVDHSEYKRKQAPPGIKITPKAFGFGRRMPITNRYRQ